MADYKVIWSKPARKDLAKISSYMTYQALAPLAGANLIKKLRKAGNNLSFSPYGPFHNKRLGVRKSVVGKYLIFFITDEEERTVLITQVVDGRRNLKKAFRRPPR
jgi:plasmid stabilization system protein ParE